MIDYLFSLSLRNKSRIIFWFKILYFFQCALLTIGGYVLLHRMPFSFTFYQIGLWEGRIAILLYSVTTIPGVTRRFGFHHKAIGIIMLFRRYIGITMFLSVFIHFWLVRGIDLFFRGLIQIPVFQWFGIGALLCLVPMFLTSNDFSVSKLGVWWGRIHTVTYVLIWFIFAHVALQRLSIWTVLIGTFAVLQISSHLFACFKQRQMNVSGQ